MYDDVMCGGLIKRGPDIGRGQTVAEIETSNRREEIERD
jgi:hypothetical protein